MCGSDGSILPFLSFAKTSSNVSEIPKTNDDTNVQYSENIHKEDSQPQLPENNSDIDIDTELPTQYALHNMPFEDGRKWLKYVVYKYDS